MRLGLTPRFALAIAAALLARAEKLPTVANVELQPLAAQAERVATALELLGDPLPAADRTALRAAKTVGAIQDILDKHCLVGVNINPESRVKAQQGEARPELMEQGWRTFLVKVHNEAGITAVLTVDSPNAGQLANTGAGMVGRRWIDLQMFNRQPLTGRLSGLEVEYRILQIYSKDAGKREAKLSFDAGQGTQDLGFRSEVDILFTAKAAASVSFRVLDWNDQPTTAAFEIRDAKGRVYPSQAKRLGGDFFFHPQVYRANGEKVNLPAGDYTIKYSRGPEYIGKTQKLTVGEQPVEAVFRLERWIDPATMGWYSGDHHIHAAGCAHYERPTEGVYPQDMMRHTLGEDLKIGSVLTWGPGWYFQKTFFEGKDHAVSTKDYKIRYDVEVSGHPSSHTGHIVLLGLKEQDFPGTQRIEDWPTWGIPILRWAKGQKAVTGYAHSGWGLAIPEPPGEVKRLSYAPMPFDGIGANEYVVSVTHGATDFISTVDTPWPYELTIWYHTLNAGYRARISGETDFPCIYGERVGLGRSYVKQKELDYADWVQGIREGRNYVSDGKSHLIDFKVNDAVMGSGESELKMSTPGNVRVSAKVAARLDETPDSAIRGLRVDQKPYWHIERARLGSSRKVPVEVIVNGEPVARREIDADGKLRDLSFDVMIDRSSWVALRILPSSHTNPVWVTVGGKPVRERKSIEWALDGVDRCFKQKINRIRLPEQGEMTRAYDFAREQYKARLAEAP
ncbi:MAG TPA: CehA/McbA family metallohydrolase [Bryobacteraceae bacterium]|nr:CehA/McbA family metallohydrolase [Bryobacteraceae bacterium]